MKVCIAEKPSVARDLARILGANQRKDGFFEGNGYRVTWTFGHLCTLKDPADYNSMWKRWTISSLPMIPERFGIKLIDDPGYKKQFEIIKTIMADADEVINCGDAGQEGELIQRWVLQKADVKCPVRRLWISSMTDEAIKEGFNNLKDAKYFENLYFAGLSRAIGDWLLGLNSTRLFSLHFSSPGTTLSVGRVQTPTLSMIVARQKEIDNFKSSEYWELKIKYRDVIFNQSPSKKFGTQEETESLKNALKGNPFIISSVERKKAKESAPRLFDLTSLQVECNNKWGWSAEITLNLLQTLYEKKLVTYPRVDTTYLSEDIFPKIPDLLRKMTPYENFTKNILAGKLMKSKKIFDNSKVTDHHAIIPTGESPRNLSEQKERLLYHLIALRLLANFYPDCQYNVTTVFGKIQELEFKATGKTIVEKGWREIIQPETSDKKTSDEEAILPEFTVGESGNCKPEVVKRTTQPPKHFTEATLLKAMETAGKGFESEELREALKENGIGRPSTRSSIIETLIRRGYVQRQRKKLIATQAGQQLIDTISYDLLKSAELTGHWERKLRMIEAGKYSAAEFIGELKEQLNDIIVSVLNTPKNQIIVEQKGKGYTVASKKRTATRKNDKGK